MSTVDLAPALGQIDRPLARIAADIDALGQLEKTEDYKSQVGTSERTGAVIENKLSLQWFIDMNKFMEKNPEVLNAVLSDEITFHPAKLKNTYGKCKKFILCLYVSKGDFYPNSFENISRKFYQPDFNWSWYPVIIAFLQLARLPT